MKMLISGGMGAKSIGVMALAIGLAAAPAAGHAQADVAVPPPSTPRESVDAGDPARFRTSIVGIETRIADDATSAETLGTRRSGSGVIIGDRLVLTIGYLVLEADMVDVTTSNGKRVPGAVAAYDAASGFGLVRTLVPISGRVLALGDADAIGERAAVWTQGHDEPEATEVRVISRKRFTGSWEYMIDRAIYTFPPVHNWSGAALIAADGRLVGIGSLIVDDAATDRRGVPGNLFVPVDLVKPVLPDLIARGRRSSPPQPWLGVSTEDVRGNVIVSRVAREGPAEAAGLRAGDVIRSINGRPVDSATDAAGLTAQLRPGTHLTLDVERGGATVPIAITIAGAP